MPEEIEDQVDHELTSEEAQDYLREVLAWARAEAATHRNSDPIQGRAAAMVATHVEDALRILILPVP